MIRINDNFSKLAPNYLFSDVARKIAAYQTANPGSDIIRMGIGDVTRPLCSVAVDAMKKAADEQLRAETFHGYGPEQGYAFLREAIAQGDYAGRGIDIDASEIFVNDGAKSDTGNIGDIFSHECRVAVTDPVYPVYVDTNLMAGRSIIYLPCTVDNGFVPKLPDVVPDLIYLCYPNNPTGTTLTFGQLSVWVNYARQHGALILFDSAYEAYISEDNVPHSIYEIPGARECAIEFRSFSKTAGFTGMRCGYTVVPHEVKGVDAQGDRVSVHALWNRRQCTKFNGASYPVQKAAAALYTPEGRRQVRETISYYMENARIMRQGLSAAGFDVVGGVNAPYLWLKTPGETSSWEFFDRLLEICHVAGTPGSGFGAAGEGWFRLTAFNTRENTVEGVTRIVNAFDRLNK